MPQKKGCETLPTLREEQSTLRLIRQDADALGVVWKSKSKLQLHRIQGGSLADESGGAEFLNKYLIKVNGQQVKNVPELRKAMGVDGGVGVLDFVFNDYDRVQAAVMLQKFFRGRRARAVVKKAKKRQGKQLDFTSYPLDLLVRLQCFSRRWLAIQKADDLRVERSKRLAVTMRRPSSLYVGRSVGVSGLFQSPSKAAGFSLHHKKLPQTPVFSPTRRASQIVHRASSMLKPDPLRRASMPA
eukprot:TRINITY_DN4233_c0_g2_i1.p1 TRINITY_DN4233_c0_g2~~TRINITY_DN4233_c0_g2_i1.p1  ORF type:complete len:242 (+),score=25.04 TRINITY_DN4233_c0_g2_i1:99-824(+)